MSDADHLAAEIRSRLAPLAPSICALDDESAQHAGHAGARSGGRHYRLRLVSAEFSGLSTVTRHRKVYALLGDLMRQKIHALALTTQAPEEI
jgi:BolA protein